MYILVATGVVKGIRVYGNRLVFGIGGIKAITSSKKAMVVRVTCLLYVECANLRFHFFKL
jgi:hypothetical protein